MSKAVLVTGPSSGIGRATAIEFAKRGARLVLGSPGEETGAALLKDLGDVPALFQRTDVAIQVGTCRTRILRRHHTISTVAPHRRQARHSVAVRRPRASGLRGTSFRDSGAVSRHAVCVMNEPSKMTAEHLYVPFRNRSSDAMRRAKCWVVGALALSGALAACSGAAPEAGNVSGAGPGIGGGTVRVDADGRRGDAGPHVPLKGVAFLGACSDIDTLGVSWFYDWGTSTRCKTNAQFVPQVWGDWAQNDAGMAPSPPASLARANQKVILGFNEPDHADQANMTVDRALALWPAFDQSGFERVGSPATASDGQAWFEHFMKAVERRKLRVDFIAIHWYGWSAGSCGDVRGLERYIEWAEQWHRPLWLTEWSCRMQSAEVTRAFYAAALGMFARHPLLERYAWFLTRSSADANFATATLLDASGKPTALGKDYIAAPAFH